MTPRRPPPRARTEREHAERFELPEPDWAREMREELDAGDAADLAHDERGEFMKD